MVYSYTQFEKLKREIEANVFYLKLFYYGNMLVGGIGMKYDEWKNYKLRVAERKWRNRFNRWH